MIPHSEQIKEHNARELAHIINQYSLQPYHIKAISKFLNKENEDPINKYNDNLTELKKTLSVINNSDFFSTYLHLIVPRDINGWSKSDPIDKTPSSHQIHASYARVPKTSFFSSSDMDIGRPRPPIFLKEHNIIHTVSNTIEGYKKIYTVVKPFGYDFPDLLNIEDMQFRLCDISNPNLDLNYGYTTLYIEYVRNNQDNQNNQKTNSHLNK